MADFNFSIDSDDDDDLQPTLGLISKSKDEMNESNNSSAEKNGENPSPKPTKSRSNKKALNRELSQNQSGRRNELLEKLHDDGYEYNSHTQAFLNYLVRTSPETRNVKSKMFKNQLMMSESMDDIPTSFAKNWLMVVCPVGSRCMVVASMGYTGAYSKTGYHIISHPSSLPMGNKTMQGFGSCVLDCIYCMETETYFVLDMMFWDGQPLYDCETQVRFKQLQEKIREYDLGRPSRQNPYPFVPLKTYTPTKSNICGAVRTAPYMIDGLLFYHKQGTYTAGSTPLVLWLTLDRLPTKMKIEIPEMGIITSISYKDPVALALAHGVSPAIISQVYPTNTGMRGLGRSGRGRDAAAQGRLFREYSTLPASHGYKQGPQGFYGWQQMRRGERAFYPNDDFGYLSEMMMSMNLSHGNHAGFGQYEHPMMASADSFYANLNSNNNAPFYNSRSGGDYNDRSRFQPHSLHFKSQAGKKKKKSQNEEHKRRNWQEEHNAMNSHWMINKPENFESDYLTIVSPVGKRRIIVAAKGRTCTYNKYGKLIDSFVSSLPSGGPNHVAGSTDLVILDSIWCGSLQKFYVFDVLNWRQQPFYDAEAEFRSFWVSDKISNVTLKHSQKEFAVEVLPMVQSNPEVIMAALTSAEYKIDGLLCYPKNSKYSLSSTKTQALWLRLDMMLELLGYPPLEGTNYRSSTEKERKQRLQFQDLTSESETPTPAAASNTDEEEESPGEA